MDEKNNDMVKLWEQMGSSTGSMIGRFIGLNARMALDIFNNNVVMPTKNLEKSQSGDTNEKDSGLRSKTWGEMGEEFGRLSGEFIGTGMDAVVNTFKNNVIKPMDENEHENEKGK